MPVYAEFCSLDAVSVVGGFHIVVGPEGESHLSPGHERALQMVRAEADRLLRAASVEHTLAGFGISHEAVGYGRESVFQLAGDEAERVELVARSRLVHLEMQMRSLRGSRISADGDELSACHR